MNSQSCFWFQTSFYSNDLASNKRSQSWKLKERPHAVHTESSLLSQEAATASSQKNPAARPLYITLRLFIQQFTQTRFLFGSWLLVCSLQCEHFHFERTKSTATAIMQSRQTGCVFIDWEKKTIGRWAPTSVRKRCISQIKHANQIVLFSHAAAVNPIIYHLSIHLVCIDAPPKRAMHSRLRPFRQPSVFKFHISYILRFLAGLSGVLPQLLGFLQTSTVGPLSSTMATAQSRKGSCVRGCVFAICSVECSSLDPSEHDVLLHCVDVIAQRFHLMGFDLNQGVIHRFEPTSGGVPLKAL